MIVLRPPTIIVNVSIFKKQVLFALTYSKLLLWKRWGFCQQYLIDGKSPKFKDRFPIMEEGAPAEKDSDLKLFSILPPV